jgi:hypothetical protein
MAAMIENNGFDGLEWVVTEAHGICNQILLFEALEMNENEVRKIIDYLIAKKVSRVMASP